MFTKRTTAALFALAIASSLIVASGLMGSAFAAKKSSKPGDNTYITLSNGKDKSSGKSPQVNDQRDSGSGTKDDSGSGTKDDSGSGTSGSGVSPGDLKKLSKCESGSAADGELTLAEVHDCYNQVFG